MQKVGNLHRAVVFPCQSKKEFIYPLCLCHQEEVLESLSPVQKAELFLDPDSGALEDEVFAREVLTALTESPDDDQLQEFFEAFADISEQVSA